MLVYLDTRLCGQFMPTSHSPCGMSDLRAHMVLHATCQVKVHVERLVPSKKPGNEAMHRYVIIDLRIIYGRPVYGLSNTIHSKNCNRKKSETLLSKLKHG